MTESLGAECDAFRGVLASTSLPVCIPRNSNELAAFVERTADDLKRAEAELLGFKQALLLTAEASRDELSIELECIQRETLDAQERLQVFKPRVHGASILQFGRPRPFN